MRGVLTLLFGAIAAVAAIAIVGAYFFAHGGAPLRAGGGGGPAMLAGAPAQTFEVKGIDGRPGGLAHYRGNVVLVNLWASWCAPCRSETPALERLYERNQARGLVVLGVDQGESIDAAKRFATELHLRYPILVDEDQEYGRAYAAVGLPTSLLVDRTGRIVRGVDGELSLADMQRLVDPALHAQ